jgi:hypothetical protein
LNIQAAIVQAFIIKNLPVESTNVSVFTTADGSAEFSPIVTTHQVLLIELTVLFNQRFAAVQDLSSNVLHTANQSISDVVVN